MLNDPNNKFYMGSDEMKITAPIDKIESLLAVRTDRTIDMTEDDFVFTKNQPAISGNGNMRYPGDALFIPDASPATNDAYWDTVPGQAYRRTVVSNFFSLDITNLPTNLQENEVIKITYHTEITVVGINDGSYFIIPRDEAFFFTSDNIDNTTNLSPFDIEWRTSGTETPESLVTYRCTGVTVELRESVRLGQMIILYNHTFLAVNGIEIGDTLRQVRDGITITGVIDDTYIGLDGRRVVVLKNLKTSSDGEFFIYPGRGRYDIPKRVHRLNSDGTTTPSYNGSWERLHNNNNSHRMIGDYGDQTTASKTITFSTPLEYTILIDNTVT